MFKEINQHHQALHARSEDLDCGGRWCNHTHESGWIFLHQGCIRIQQWPKNEWNLEQVDLSPKKLEPPNGLIARSLNPWILPIILIANNISDMTILKPALLSLKNSIIATATSLIWMGPSKHSSLNYIHHLDILYYCDEGCFFENSQFVKTWFSLFVIRPL